MTEKHTGHPLFYELTEEEIELHDAKNKDYAHDGDPLGNFKRVSALLKIWGFDISPTLVALIYALKQQDAYMWMLSQGYEGEVENVDTRLRDDHIYKKIARILHRE
uniref:Uncharacterized protein n=1 Tax=viral metagenome TaxID=1070528 RepID=A0A6H2A1Q4_9ZZZZ